MATASKVEKLLAAFLLGFSEVREGMERFTVIRSTLRTTS